MDIKELNKTQLILLTLLITFVVSIATGIITVSLMEQAPKSVPQTINNVIQRTIEKVTTVPALAPDSKEADSNDKVQTFGEGDAIIPIYSLNLDSVTGTPIETTEAPKPLGQGVIISDVGLVLVDTIILTDKDLYKVTLNKVDFDATVIKKFNNGFAILKISQKKESIEGKKDENLKVDKTL